MKSMKTGFFAAVARFNMSNMRAVLAVFVTVVFACLCSSGNAQCTNSPYEVTTMGRTTGGAPVVTDAYQGVPFFPVLEPTKPFSIQTTVNSRIYLASSPRIQATDDYIQIEFAGDQIKITPAPGGVLGSESSSPGVLNAGQYHDFELQVSGTTVSVHQSGGGLIVNTDLALDINYILVQTPTADDAEMTMWIFCGDLMLFSVTDPANLFDEDDATCVVSETGNTGDTGISFLKLDLGGIFDIKAVLINDENTGTATALGNANVYIGTCDDMQVPVPDPVEDTIKLNRLCGTVTAEEADGATPHWILKSCGVIGQFVYIFNDATLDATVCEVEVWGIPVASGTTPKISFAETEYQELESVTPRTFTVNREGDSSSCAYFQLATPTGGTATGAGTDYDDIVAEDLEIQRLDPGVTMQEFEVTVIEDDLLEVPDETIVVELVAAMVMGAEVGDNPMTTLTILNNDVCYEWESAAYSYLENVGIATPVLKRTGYTEGTSTACVATSVDGITGAATVPDDFTALAPMTKVVFGANTVQQNVDVSITNDVCMLNINDGTNDFDEMLKVVLEPGVASCDGQTVTLCDGGITETFLTLTNDDAIYSFQTDTTTTTEAVGEITLVVKRDGNIAVDSPAITIESQPRINVDPAFETATEGDDYIKPTEQVTIAAGLTTVAFKVAIENDKTVELPETFSLLLGPNLDMCAVDQTKKDNNINIDDNDCYYSFESEDGGDNVIQKEIGEADGTIELVIKCERNDAILLANPGSVDLLIGEITGKTATNGEDFGGTGSTPLTVNFLPGSYVVNGATGKATAKISIDIYNDNLVENTATEMFKVSFVSASGEIGNGPIEAEFTIVDNDAKISLQETSVAVSESEPKYTAILLREGDISRSHSVRLVSSSQTATSGTSANNGDYMSINKDLTFNPGEATATVDITLFDDEEIENNETFLLSILPTSTTDLTVDPARNELTVTIVDNDCLFSLDVEADQLTVSENGAQPSITVTVRRHGDLNKVSTINLKTSIIGTPITGRDAAIPNVDYGEIDEKLVFQPGESERTASINILPDDLPEVSEVFMLYLDDPQCGIDGATRTFITILDDDEIVIKMASSKQIVNENAGMVTIPLVRTGSLVDKDIVSLSLIASSVDGKPAATPEADYKGGPYTATFEANSGDASISVPIFDDNFREQSLETFIAKIDGIDGTDSAAKVTSDPDERMTVICIQDDDCIFNLKDSNIYVSESTGSYTTYVEKVGSSNTIKTVNVYTRDGTAASPGDYSPIQTTTLSFPPGTTSQPVTFVIVNDKVEELSKNFVLILASDDGSIIGKAVTTVTIQDDDFPITFKDNNDCVYVNEGDRSVTVSVQRTRKDNAFPGESAKVMVMSREVSSTNAASDTADFDTVSSEVQFSASGTEEDVTINISNDDVPEAEEKFELFLTDPSPSSTHYISYPNVITVCITDDDGTPPDVGDGDDGQPDGDGSGISLSRSAIVLIGGGAGLILMLGTLGMIGCFAVSRMRAGVPQARPQVAPGPRSPPPAYREPPIELRRQQSRNYYNNRGYSC